MSERDYFAQVPERVWRSWPIRQKVVCLILQLGHPNPDDTKDRRVRGTHFGRQEELAARLGTTVGTVKNALRAERKAGNLIVRGTHIGNGYDGFNAYAVVGATDLPPGEAIDLLASRFGLNLLPDHGESPGRQAGTDSIPPTAQAGTDSIPAAGTDSIPPAGTDSIPAIGRDHQEEDHQPSDHDSLSSTDAFKSQQPSRSERENHLADEDGEALEGSGTAESFATELLRAARRTPSPKSVTAVVGVLRAGVPVDEVARSLARQDLKAVTAAAIEWGIGENHRRKSRGEAAREHEYDAEGNLLPDRPARSFGKRDHVQELMDLPFDEHGNLPPSSDGSLFGGLFDTSPAIEANVIETTAADEPSATTIRMGDGRLIAIEPTTLIREGGIGR